LTSLKGIPIVESGSKYRTEVGIRAVKNGVKKAAEAAPRPAGGKPKWLKVPIATGARFNELRRNVREHRLSTVCEESFCPNMGECWNNGTATIMLMGSVCTRACRFCAVDTGNPRGWIDLDEPENTARSVQLMDLRYVVLTSVDRDDLPDGGAQHYADCVRAIKGVNSHTAVEALTPDFQGDPAAVNTVVNSGLEVFAHNVETVARLTRRVRDPRAGYKQSLAVLAAAGTSGANVLTKTSLMLGLGETDSEIDQVMDDLREIDVDILTLGQYLQPTANHLPVERYVPPDEFEQYRRRGLEKGFVEVVAGPLVRSSYRADRVLDGNNAGLNTTS